MVFQSNNDFAGPDDTGRELFCSIAHADLHLYTNRVVLYGDVNMFTDYEGCAALNPTELDWNVGIAVRWGILNWAYREGDRPFD
jgi:hypothetical protein